MTQYTLILIQPVIVRYPEGGPKDHAFEAKLSLNLDFVPPPGLAIRMPHGDEWLRVTTADVFVLNQVIYEGQTATGEVHLTGEATPLEVFPELELPGIDCERIASPSWWGTVGWTTQVVDLSKYNEGSDYDDDLEPREDLN